MSVAVGPLGRCGLGTTGRSALDRAAVRCEHDGMTTDGHDHDRPHPSASTDDERPVLDEDDDTLPDHLDLPVETPEADALDQQRAEPFDEET